jgi:hypothetical protein
MAKVRIKCPQCQSEDTWATYIHDPCPNAPTGKTQWTEEAMGPTPDGTPSPRPCPAPGDGTSVPCAYVDCHSCMHHW